MAATADGADRSTARRSSAAGAPDLGTAGRGRGVRAIPARQVHRPEAVLARRRRTLIPLLNTLIEARRGAGRRRSRHGHGPPRPANVLAHVLNKPYEMILSEFEGTPRRKRPRATATSSITSAMPTTASPAQGHKIHCSLSPNPSHLELINPVIEGIVRAEAGRAAATTSARRVVAAADPRRRRVHRAGHRPGDAQPVELPGYRTGGTIHVIVNNQIGFTTHARAGRASRPIRPTSPR